MPFRRQSDVDALTYLLPGKVGLLSVFCFLWVMCVWTYTKVRHFGFIWPLILTDVPCLKVVLTPPGFARDVSALEDKLFFA